MKKAIEYTTSAEDAAAGSGPNAAERLARLRETGSRALNRIRLLGLAALLATFMAGTDDVSAAWPTARLRWPRSISPTRITKAL